VNSIGLKPDITAVGGGIYVATQTLDPNGDMYDPSGYVLVDGTSFSAPLVAGAAALIKSARPGLSVDQYRSLLINSAATAQTHSGETPGIQQAGAGLLDTNAALHSTVTAYPASLNLGAGNRILTLTNLAAAQETFTIAATPQSGEATPAVASSTVELSAGSSVGLPVSWNAGGQAPGTYQGVLTITGTSSGTRIHVPYWYAVMTDVPAHITILDSTASGRRGSVQRQAVLFRITDVSGLNLAGAQPVVTAVSGGGMARGVVSYDSDVPGMFGVDVQLGPVAGANVFRIQAGDVTAEVSITAQ
jgi:minor extracellular serine protease Vpr